MTQMQIYFGDLTHDTVGLATEVFPLNVGYVAAYCKKILGDKVDVRIFKYVKDLEENIIKNPPDVLALSNYPWCHNIDMAMMELIADRRPEAMRMMGGPNFPHLQGLQEEFLKEHPLIDTYAYLDGEVPAANFLNFILDAGNLVEARKTLPDTNVPGCYHLGRNGKLIEGAAPARLKELDEIPSPYLTGLMDPFFDGRLSPMMQTNRGCPFQCTFCHDGTSAVSKVNHFSIERVNAEIDYITDRVPENIHSLFLSDLNFGMYKRDLEICQKLADTKKRHNYPLYIDTTTGKNSKKRIVNAIEKLDGVLRMTMSVQSMTPEVLKNIKRDNISVEDFLDLKPVIQRINVPTVSEVILGLPGETKESHISTLSDLLQLEMEDVLSYTLMLVNGSEMSTPEQREKYGFKTKYRIIPRDFTKLSSGRNVVEIEEVVIETNTLSFEDYLYCRKVSFLLYITNNRGLRPLFRFLISKDLPAMELVRSMLDNIEGGDIDDETKAAPASLIKLIKAYERDSIDELWDSSKELEEFFHDDDHFKGLIDGKYGANLMQTHRARAFSEDIQDLVFCAFYHARNLCRNHGSDEATLLLLDEIELYCRAQVHNILGDNRYETVPEIVLNHDLIAWSEETANKDPEDYKWDAPRVVRFPLTDEQVKIVEDSLDHFGRTILGKGKMLIRINANILWRRPQVSGDTPEITIEPWQVKKEKHRPDWPI